MVIAFPVPCLASIVIHDGQSGIVASTSTHVLDSSGHVWFLHQNEGWIRNPDSDPPMPVDQIKLWEHYSLITIDDVYWRIGGGPGWVDFGVWPDAAASVETRLGAMPGPTLAPNPSRSPCRASFHLAAEGPVSLEIVDVAGRMIRGLLDGPHPAGEYSVIWDGRDDAGREVPSGVYWTRILTAEGATTGRIVLAR